MMLYFNQEKKNCTGCAACYSVCPKQCIHMVQDEEGYLYPESNDSCVNCGLCETVCPMIHPLLKNDYTKKVIAATSKSDEIWKRSASGGAFSEICRAWADDKTLIVGAAWDGMKVHHIGVFGFDNIAPLCKSKYISSPIENTFKDIHTHLLTGNKVIFCGCPCQVAGLISFLRKPYKNLLTIDLICHGQGSQYVFDECIKYLKKMIGEDIIGYDFRAKRDIFEVEYLSRLKTKNKEHFVYYDPYIQLFIGKLALRNCCGENCKFHNINRPGDLTIADFKGLKNIYPDLVGSLRNYSTIVSNTEKGELSVQSLSQTMEIRSSSVDSVIKYNPFFAHNTWHFEHRDEFFIDFQTNPQEAIAKWANKKMIFKTNDFIYLLFHFSPKLLWPLWGKIIGFSKKIIRG